ATLWMTGKAKNKRVNRTIGSTKLYGGNHRCHRPARFFGGRKLTGPDRPGRSFASPICVTVCIQLTTSNHRKAPRVKPEMINRLKYSTTTTAGIAVSTLPGSKNLQSTPYCPTAL